MAYTKHDRIRPRAKIYAADIQDIDSQVEIHDRQLAEVAQSLNGKVDEIILSEDRKYIVFKANGETITEVGPIAGEGGGGGGGGDSGTVTVMTLTNESGWLAKTIAAGTELSVSCSWVSTLDEIPTGAGILRVYVGGVVRSTQNVAQGRFTVNITKYLAAGNNSVRINVTDVYGISRDIRYTIMVENFSISSPFEYQTPVNGAFTFYYTPVGDITKTVHFKVDSTELPTETVEVSNRQQSKTIPAQTHGAHTLNVWFTAELDGAEVESNHLWYDFMSINPESTAPVITSQYNTGDAEQYQTIVIPYQVYSPADLTAQVELIVDGTTVQTITVDRTEQQWSYRPLDYGNKVFQIRCGNTTKTFNIAVAQSAASIGAVTEDLTLYLTAQGRSNGEANPAVWTYEDIAATMTGFNFSKDGWLLDDDGVSVLRVTGDARVEIPYKIFARDFRSTGKTIELEFATRNVMNYDSPIISCISGGRGLEVTPQLVKLASEQAHIQTQYKEDEHVRISFVIEKRTEHRLIYCYINGIMCGTVRYPDDDDFSQVTPVNISIGSSDCATDIYCIRVYDNSLTRHQVVGNWIADTQDATLMLERYDRNNIYDNYSNVVIEKLPNDLPYMIITCPQLPQYKGDKKTCTIQYVDPVHPEKSFTAENVQIDVQGTSSQYYRRKNYKTKYNSGFVNNAGQTSSKYAMRDDSIPVKTFCMKADVASSEGANNVELVRAYEEACPYRTPAQLEDERVRQGIDGFPCVIFYNDGVSTSFLGKYNFNNDKSTEDVFGFGSGDESWEILNNTSNRVIWKNDDFSGTEWLNDFEARYPDTDPAYTDAAQLAEFALWAKSTDTTAATGNALATPVTYAGVTYTTDSAEYRLAKFKAEAATYMEMDSALFYYLFTELFLMVDSRAKNAFPSFIGSEVTA